MTDATAAGQQGITGAVTGGQQRIDTATQRSQDLLQPYIGAGSQSLSTLMGGLAPGGDLNKQFTAADMQAYDPGYAFRMSQATKALAGSAAARGGALGGGALTALSSLNQNLASGEFANAEQRFRAQQTDRFNRLNSLVNLGATSANQAAGYGMTGADEAARLGLTGATAGADLGYRGAMGAGGFTTEATREQAQNALNTYGKIGDLMTGGARRRPRAPWARRMRGPVRSAASPARQPSGRLLPGSDHDEGLHAESSAWWWGLRGEPENGARLHAVEALMAIDPSISLAVRPPVIAPLQIQTPLERFAKILSLRNLMTQGQLGQLGLQTHQLELRKLQQEMEGQDRINKILAARSAAAAPLQTAPAVPLLRLQHHRSPRPTHLLRPTRRSQAQRPVGR